MSPIRRAAAASGRHARGVVATIAAIAIGATAAHADSVTLEGSAIPIRGCTIQSIRSGRVIFLDARSQRHERRHEEVAALGFDGFDQLDLAERRISERSYAEGIAALLRAMLDADTDAKRLWTHARLAQVHDLRGEFVQAAGHAAEVFALDDDAAWLELEPVSPPNEPGYAATLEAVESLRRARRTVQSASIRRAVDRLLASVRPVHDRLEAVYDGPEIEPGSTISGIDRERIAAGAESPPTPRPPVPTVATGVLARPEPEPAIVMTPRPESPTPSVTPPPRPRPDAAAPDSIAALIEAERFADAVERCRQLERRLDDRPLGPFLYRYGRALAGVGRQRDAAVMFMRCAVLHPGTRHAEMSLIETAIIYRDVFKHTPRARRLLERAVSEASRHGRPEVAIRARGVLDTLPEKSE